MLLTFYYLQGATAWCHFFTSFRSPILRNFFRFPIIQNILSKNFHFLNKKNFATDTVTHQYLASFLNLFLYVNYIFFENHVIFRFRFTIYFEISIIFLKNFLFSALRKFITITKYHIYILFIIFQIVSNEEQNNQNFFQICPSKIMLLVSETLALPWKKKKRTSIQPQRHEGYLKAI